VNQSCSYRYPSNRLVSIGDELTRPQLSIGDDDG